MKPGILSEKNKNIVQSEISNPKHNYTLYSMIACCEPKLVENSLKILDKEIPKLKSKIKSVQLCFTIDPFMYGYDEVSQMSIAIMRKLNANGIKCTALTKGILPFELSWLSKDNEYGILSVFYFFPTADL